MTQTNKTSLSDIPFRECVNDFGTESYVNGLIKFIENSSAPITIALQGEWGSGKTSMMTRLERALCSNMNAPFIGVNINTWEYSMMSSPEITVYKILAQLVRALTGKNTDSKKKISKILKGLLYRGGRETLKQIPGVGPGLGIIMEMANIPTDISIDEDVISLSELRDELQSAVQSQIVEKNKRGVIVFVDDLDRLNPPVAVEILELLKNVFTLNNCIFVLAIDYDVVVKGLEPKFGKLTNQNEREFRSFFDKIIQVPFSLPISSYKPMDFVMRSLRDIGYLPKDMELKNDQISMFSTVVEASVGNNPRSLKRLINTLSLLDCIAQAKQNDGAFTKNEETHGFDKASTDGVEHVLREKLLNFIIVAIQISYPRIYTLLVHKPNFTDWDNEFASREGINSASLIEAEEPDWSEVLEAACSSDKYLTQRYLDISKLFSMIIDIIAPDGGNMRESIGCMLKEILDKASVTGVKSNVKVEEFDKKTFIHKLHENVGRRIHQLRTDIIENLKTRNNTGNGGFKFKTEDGYGYDIRFVPSYNPDNTVTLKIEMSTQIMRSEKSLGMSLDELLTNHRLAHALSVFDSKISPLLQERPYLKSIHSKGEKSNFSSFSEELSYLHQAGHMSGDITHDAVYLINLPKSSDFEDGKIVDVIADMVIANYDFRNSMNNLEI